jgi:hypothetical protein
MREPYDASHELAAWHALEPTSAATAMRNAHNSLDHDFSGKRHCKDHCRGDGLSFQ